MSDQTPEGFPEGYEAGVHDLPEDHYGKIEDIYYTPPEGRKDARLKLNFSKQVPVRKRDGTYVTIRRFYNTEQMWGEQAVRVYQSAKKGRFIHVVGYGHVENWESEKGSGKYDTYAHTPSISPMWFDEQYLLNQANESDTEHF